MRASKLGRRRALWRLMALPFVLALSVTVWLWLSIPTAGPVPATDPALLAPSEASTPEPQVLAAVPPLEDSTGASAAQLEGGTNLYLPLVQKSQSGSQPVPTPWPPIEGNREWSTLAANPQRTSWVAEEVRGDLKIEWYRPIEPFIPYKVQPIAANGMIYVSSARGLYALNAVNGAVNWVYPTEMPLGHSPTVYTVRSRSTVFVGGYDRVIHALDAFTGQNVPGYSPFMAGAGFETNPLLVGEVIYAGNRDGYFYALDAVTGELIWKYKTEGPILYSAAYKDGVVYFASNDAHAYALNTAPGLSEPDRLVWKSQKFPGAGFHSFWPVIYTDKQTGKDYVAFSGAENYDQQVLNVPVAEAATLFEGIPDGGLIGPTSNSIPGDWVAGTLVIDARRIIEYHQERPDRRMVFVLDRATGKEFTFDSNGDGLLEYAPFSWTGVNDSGNRYPPIVNGVDGVYYQATSYISDDYYSRGDPVGWKFGTQYVSRIDSGRSEGHASDEPLAYSSGGRLIYWSLCCDREAGAVDITLPFGQRSRAWQYYSYNLANNVLAPGYQQMYDGGNAAAYAIPQGWQVYSGANQSKNGVYGKHGTTQSPPVPYQGKVYILKGNSLVAFSPSGTSPKTPLELATIVAPRSTAVTPSREALAARLEAEVQKMLDAGHLRPGYDSAGFTDLFGDAAGYRGEKAFGEIFDYFQSPADTVYSLLLAYPHLTSTTQQQVRTYLATHYGPGATYDLTSIVHIGWGTGTPREVLDLPPEVQSQWLTQTREPFQPSTKPQCSNCGYWEKFPPFSFYAAWKYAQIVGDSNPAVAKDIFDRISAKLELPLSDAIFTTKPYWLNLYLAGYKGYVELRKLAGYDPDQKTANYQTMLDLRASAFSKDTPYLPLGNDISNDYSYNNTLAVARNFMFLTPEVADELANLIPSQVRAAVDEYEYVAPYWFVSKFDQSYGETTFQHLYDSPAIFQAKAFALNEPYSELAKWIDTPTFRQGDLFYIQNIAAALSAP